MNSRQRLGIQQHGSEIQQGNWYSEIKSFKMLEMKNKINQV
jgi:hypothetical protein